MQSSENHEANSFIYLLQCGLANHANNCSASGVTIASPNPLNNKIKYVGRVGEYICEYFDCINKL